MDTLLEALINGEIDSFKMERQDTLGRVVELTVVIDKQKCFRYIDFVEIQQKRPRNIHLELNNVVGQILEEFKKGV